MMTFDRVLPELIRICNDDAATRDAIARYTIVRDVRGRVRLVVKPRAAKPALSLDGLQQSLGAALGGWFIGPVVSVHASGEMRRLAETILKHTKGKWPAGWPRSIRNVLGGEDTPIAVGETWTGLERTIGKEAWLTTEPPAPPWTLAQRKAPPIVTFHSFKGGVGRTTQVAAHAVRLASRKKPARVAIVDLDLEAPGVGDLFEVRTARGTLDVIVDHIATGELNLDEASAAAQIDPSVDPYITVFPAGRIDDGYVQKLARLDFSSPEPDGKNPVGEALKALLTRLRADFDVILLDARSGLHDIAGMSLHGLAHVAVLTFRGTTQNFAGVEQTLRTLGTRDHTSVVLVETLLPANDEATFQSRRERTLDRVYDMMCEHVYGDDPPQRDDKGEAHDVLSVRRRDWLDGIDSLKGRVRDMLNETELGQVSARIDEKCLLEAEAESELDAADEDEEPT